MITFCHSRAGGNPVLFQVLGIWMPVEDPVYSGDQVRHDGSEIKLLFEFWHSRLPGNDGLSAGQAVDELLDMGNIR
jgi:hypothetical protein